MKHLLKLFPVILSLLVSCNKFDDSEIWDKLNDHEKRIVYLEDLCKRMNADLVNLQAIVTALETNDYIVNASPLATGDGYSLIFKSGKSVVIYNGKNGTDGTDGEDGKDGVTPVISVKQDTDGIYYWTVNGEWLLVDGKKVKASASDGNDGTNGTDGTTPKFKIEEGYWYVSYNNGSSWDILGKAVGDNGLNGENGDTIIKYISVEKDYVKFVLNDENETVLKLSVVKEIKAVTINISERGTLSKYIGSKEAEGVERLICTGNLNATDLDFIYSFFLSAVEIDLSNCNYDDYDCQYPTGATPMVSNPYANRALEILKLPSNLVNFTSFYPNLKVVEYQTSKCVDGNETFYVKLPNALYYRYSINGTSSEGVSLKLNRVELAHGIEGIYDDMANIYEEKINSYRSYFASCDTLCIPSSVNTVANTWLCYGSSKEEMTCDEIGVIVCKAEVPPTLHYPDSKRVTTGKFCTDYFTMPTTTKYTAQINNPLYVPAGSVESYKNAEGWSQFKTILPIEE